MGFELWSEDGNGRQVRGVRAKEGRALHQATSPLVASGREYGPDGALESGSAGDRTIPLRMRAEWPEDADPSAVEAVLSLGAGSGHRVWSGGAVAVGWPMAPSAAMPLSELLSGDWAVEAEDAVDSLVEVALSGLPFGGDGMPVSSFALRMEVLEVETRQPGAAFARSAAEPLRIASGDAYANMPGVMAKSAAGFVHVPAQDGHPETFLVPFSPMGTSLLVGTEVLLSPSYKNRPINGKLNGHERIKTFPAVVGFTTDNLFVAEVPDISKLMLEQEERVKKILREYGWIEGEEQSNVFPIHVNLAIDTCMERSVDPSCASASESREDSHPFYFWAKGGQPRLRSDMELTSVAPMFLGVRYPPEAQAIVGKHVVLDFEVVNNDTGHVVDAAHLMVHPNLKNIEHLVVPFDKKEVNPKDTIKKRIDGFRRVTKLPFYLDGSDKILKANEEQYTYGRWLYFFGKASGLFRFQASLASRHGEYNRWALGDKALVRLYDLDNEIINYLNHRDGKWNSSQGYGANRPIVPGTISQVVHVHGFMNSGNSGRKLGRIWLERLYWGGYNGGFSALLWHADRYIKTDFPRVFVNALGLLADFGGILFKRTPRVFNANVEESMKTAPDLTIPYEPPLGIRSRLHFTAHSLGNFVVSKALHDLGSDGGAKAAATYVMSQAATPASGYYPKETPVPDEYDRGGKEIPDDKEYQGFFVNAHKAVDAMHNTYSKPDSVLAKFYQFNEERKNIRAAHKDPVKQAAYGTVSKYMAAGRVPLAGAPGLAHPEDMQPYIKSDHSKMHNSPMHENLFDFWTTMVDFLHP